MAMTLLDALAALDTTNDDHWTADGLPRIDPLTEMVGISIQRQSVTAIAPEFTRANPVLPGKVTSDTVVTPPEPFLEGSPDFSEVTPEPEPSVNEVLDAVKTGAAAVAEAKERLDKAGRDVKVALSELDAARQAYEHVVFKNRKTAAQRRIESRQAIKRFQRSQAKNRGARN